MLAVGTELPFPPRELMLRTGSFVAEDEEATYQAIGAMAQGGDSRASSPSGWSFSGKRLLDFGCGAGRVLGTSTRRAGRRRSPAATSTRPSIEWIARNLPWLDAFVVERSPADAAARRLVTT